LPDSTERLERVWMASLVPKGSHWTELNLRTSRLIRIYWWGKDCFLVSNSSIEYLVVFFSLYSFIIAR
jgi:hypothetical protein